MLSVPPPEEEEDDKEMHEARTLLAGAARLNGRVSDMIQRAMAKNGEMWEMSKRKRSEAEANGDERMRRLSEEHQVQARQQADRIEHLTAEVTRLGATLEMERAKKDADDPKQEGQQKLQKLQKLQTLQTTFETLQEELDKNNEAWKQKIKQDLAKNNRLWEQTLEKAHQELATNTREAFLVQETWSEAHDTILRRLGVDASTLDGHLSRVEAHGGLPRLLEQHASDSPKPLLDNVGFHLLDHTEPDFEPHFDLLDPL